MPAVIQDGVHQSWMIENGIARLDIAQKIDKRNLIGLRTCEGAHNEVEISSSKPRAYGKSDCWRRAIFAKITSKLYLPCGGLMATGLTVASRCCCSEFSVAISLIWRVISP